MVAVFSYGQATLIDVLILIILLVAAQVETSRASNRRSHVPATTSLSERAAIFS